jgi:hypothetical protein
MSPRCTTDSVADSMRPALPAWWPGPPLRRGSQAQAARDSQAGVQGEVSLFGRHRGCWIVRASRPMLPEAPGQNDNGRPQDARLPDAFGPHDQARCAPDSSTQFG